MSTGLLVVPNKICIYYIIRLPNNKRAIVLLNHIFFFLILFEDEASGKLDINDLLVNLFLCL